MRYCDSAVGLVSEFRLEAHAVKFYQNLLGIGDDHNHTAFQSASNTPTPAAVSKDSSVGRELHARWEAI